VSRDCRFFIFQIDWYHATSPVFMRMLFKLSLWIARSAYLAQRSRLSLIATETS